MKPVENFKFFVFFDNSLLCTLDPRPKVHHKCFSCMLHWRFTAHSYIRPAPGKQPYFEISEMTTHPKRTVTHARDHWWTLDFANSFLSPGVNSRAELIPSTRAYARNGEREVCTEKYRTEVFFEMIEPVRRARFVQKDRGLIFFCTYRASEVNIKFIMWHLYLKQTRNTWFEMHISSVVHIWSKKTKNTNVFLLLH
jgi:hypothetical protein